MYYIELETARVVADFSTIRNRRYTGCQCNYKLFNNLAYAKTQAKAYANATGKCVTLKSMDTKDSFFIRPIC